MSDFRKIGTCSLCGGEVYAFHGAYFGVPPPAKCQSCGAVRDDCPSVIPMRKPEENVPSSHGIYSKGYSWSGNSK